MISSKEFCFVSSLSILFLFFVLIIVCLSTIHLKSATGTLSKCVHAFQVKLEFDSVGFCGVGKAREPGKKTCRRKERTNNKLYPQVMPGGGIKPGPHWW